MLAANRDREVFPEPDRFDIGQESKRSFSFGCGSHFCLGAALARTEVQETLRELRATPGGSSRWGRRRGRRRSFRFGGSRRFRCGWSCAERARTATARADRGDPAHALRDLRRARALHLPEDHITPTSKDEHILGVHDLVRGGAPDLSHAFEQIVDAADIALCIALLDKKLALFDAIPEEILIAHEHHTEEWRVRARQDDAGGESGKLNLCSLCRQRLSLTHPWAPGISSTPLAIFPASMSSIRCS